MLVRSAFSANIKERRDCSTALFDERGRMIAQAEHIPVHLGAMPDAVAAVHARTTRSPARSGSSTTRTRAARTCPTSRPSRAPSSASRPRARTTRTSAAASPARMPADSRTLAEEGVVIPPTRLDDGMLAELVAPMRNPDERRGDLRAQLAANRLAEQRVAELCARRGADAVAAAMDALYAYSERVVRAGIARLPDGRYEAEDVLEPIDGRARVCMRRHDRGRRASRSTSPARAASTTGTSTARSRSRARRASTSCACSSRRTCPRRAARSRPSRSPHRRAALVNARPPAAVAAGNVETSSRIVDVVMRAFGQAIPVPAQGQGTMNNVTLGNDRFTYYETIGGGQGACPAADGPSGVHVAMSNTLSTPVEALELQYPLRVERYGAAARLRRRGPRSAAATA